MYKEIWRWGGALAGWGSVMPHFRIRSGQAVASALDRLSHTLGAGLS
jgi:hypothetical protein